MLGSWGVPPPRGGSGGVPGGDPQMATAAGGMHPAGMHSCFYNGYCQGLTNQLETSNLPFLYDWLLFLLF